jgi:tRNA (guanine-N7-)-methyltransferase
LAIKRVPDDIIEKYSIKCDIDKKILTHEIFGNLNPLKVEIGCGNGHFIVDVAKDEADVNFIGIDLRLDRICKTISKLSKREMNNVRVFLGDAKDFFLKHLADDSVDEIFYNFPDPWPKRRHHKKRLFTREFLDSLARVMKCGSIFTCATDHEDYLKWMLYYLDGDNRFYYAFDEKIVKEISGYYTTWFEKLWRDMGREIYYFRFIKK